MSSDLNVLATRRAARVLCLAVSTTLFAAVGVAAGGCNATDGETTGGGGAGGSEGTTSVTEAGRTASARDECRHGGPVCAPGRGNCDKIASNGCETNLLTSNANCGACGSPCTSGKTCQAGACRSLYWASGVQQGVAVGALSGWSQCFAGDYEDSGTALASILSQCSKAKLLMACKPKAASTYTLLAMAPRADVLFDCEDAPNCTQQSNGVGWYFDESFSWGFAPGGEPVNRDSCDFNQGAQTFPELRLCWHTGADSIHTGYRCGDNDLNGDSTWVREIWHAN